VRIGFARPASATEAPAMRCAFWTRPDPGAAQPGERCMTNNVAKVIEIVGTSETGLEDAIRGALSRASQTVDNLQWFHVTEIRGALDGANVERFQVMMKVGFGLNDD
jgi:dodecin